MRRRSTACWLPLVWGCMAVAALAYYEPALPQPPPQPKWSDALRDAAAKYKGENKFDLNEFTAIQSISGSDEHAKDMEEAAQWLVGRLGHMDMQHARVFETDGVHPIVYADYLLAGDDKPTILIYGQYDVPPLNPLLSWDEPFKLGNADGSWWGRGVGGGKGALLMAIQGVEVILRTYELMNIDKEAELPFNVKLLFDGQGELGSPGLEAFLQQHRSLLSADLVLAATGAPMQGEQGSVEALPNTPGNRLALEVWSQVFGKAREYNRDPLASPALAILQEQLQLPVTVFGWGLGSDVNAPSEHLKVERYDDGRTAWIKLLLALSEKGVAQELRKANALWRQGALPAWGAAGAETRKDAPQLAAAAEADQGGCSAAKEAASAGTCSSRPHDEL